MLRIRKSAYFNCAKSERLTLRLEIPRDGRPPSGECLPLLCSAIGFRFSTARLGRAGERQKTVYGSVTNYIYSAVEDLLCFNIL